MAALLRDLAATDLSGRSGEGGSELMGVVQLAMLVAVVAGVAAGALLYADRARRSRAPEALRVDAGPIERHFRVQRAELAEEVFDNAGRVRGAHIVRDDADGMVLAVSGRNLGRRPKVDVYVHVELRAHEVGSSYVLTAQAQAPDDASGAALALSAFEAILRTYIRRSAGLSADSTST